MAQPTDIHEHALPQAGAQRRWSPPCARWASKIKLVVTRSIFWAYERGSWQYDVIVIAILAFIFLSPRAWFNDRPTLQLTDLRHQQGIVEMGRVNKKTCATWWMPAWWIHSTRNLKTPSPSFSRNISKVLHRKIHRRGARPPSGDSGLYCDGGGITSSRRAGIVVSRPDAVGAGLQSYAKRFQNLDACAAGRRHGLGARPARQRPQRQTPHRSDGNSFPDE